MIAKYKNRPLVFLLLALAWNAFLAPLHGADLTRRAKFPSVEAFAAAVKAFQPAAAKSDLSALFTVPEMGEEAHGKPIATTAVQSCELLWSGDQAALLMAKANPPTEATRSAVGVLFLLVRQNGHWRIGDLLRFAALGKYAEVSAELTADVGTGYHLGSEGMVPVITVRESSGGRGYSRQISASYALDGGKLKRLELE